MAHSRSNTADPAAPAAEVCASALPEAVTLKNETIRTKVLIPVVGPCQSGRPNAMMSDPAATATYCLLSKTYVIGDAFQNWLV